MVFSKVRYLFELKSQQIVLIFLSDYLASLTEEGFQKQFLSVLGSNISFLYASHEAILVRFFLFPLSIAKFNKQHSHMNKIVLLFAHLSDVIFFTFLNSQFPKSMIGKKNFYFWIKSLISILVWSRFTFRVPTSNLFVFKSPILRSFSNTFVLFFRECHLQLWVDFFKIIFIWTSLKSIFPNTITFKLVCALFMGSFV